MRIVSGAKSGLFALAFVRSLFYFDYVGIVQNLETVTTGREKNHISSTKFQRGTVPSVFSVEVDTNSARANKQDFLGGVDGAAHRVVNVGVDEMPLWPLENAKLVDTIVAGHEIDSRLPEACSDDDS